MSFVFAHKDTVGGAEMIVSASAAKFGGFFLNGSAASTLIIKDGATTILSTSAAANVLISVILPAPIACTTSLLATCSGDGFYSVFFAV